MIRQIATKPSIHLSLISDSLWMQRGKRYRCPPIGRPEGLIVRHRAIGSWGRVFIFGFYFDSC